MKALAAKALLTFAYIWIAQIGLLLLSTVAFEFYSGGFWHGWRKFTEWFSPFNTYGLINYLITIGPSLIAFSASEKLAKG
jgi:hypothetical protein